MVMRRADRLFRLVQKIRARPGITARRLAEELNVAQRTVYRDVADLQDSGVPLRGEAGFGYSMAPGFDLPPLMFTTEEIEALVLGARMVQSWCDPGLSSAARDALDKIDQALPRRMRDRVTQTALFVPDSGWSLPGPEQMSGLRTAIRERKKVRITYHDAQQQPTARVVHPLALFFWGSVATLGAWCELRSSFRTFRVDRISTFDVLEEEIEVKPGRTLQDYFRAAAETAPPTDG
jgi:predicted DNA-binding transcriptional regulator YafY